METGIVKIILTLWGASATAALVIGRWLFLRVIASHDAEMAKLNKSITCLGKTMETKMDELEGKVDECVPLTTFEQNRRETHETYTAIFTEIRNIGNAVARIEGRMERP